ncbi:hypothetical protein HDE69_000812 [Pedobacter cryoconitis]|uniref:Uncharacterized protein n=1 Tax=Pedobacter cryoconitis TaxID=188932 RepID=A0A7W8YQ98_9SPHI|nr:hypothetical protein [Pedobacter cryoconitis]
MKPLKYLYYRLYIYYSERPLPQLKVFFAIFGLILLNILSLFNILQIARGIKIKPSSLELEEFTIWAVLFSFPIYVLYAHYLKSGYHDQIINEFGRETKRQKLVSRLLVFLYFTFTFVGCGFAIWLRQEIFK